MGHVGMKFTEPEKEKFSMMNRKKRLKCYATN